METEEEDDTNDEDFNVEIRQFSSCSHRFSKVSEMGPRHTGVSEGLCHWPGGWYLSTAGHIKTTYCILELGIPVLKIPLFLGKVALHLDNPESLPLRRTFLFFLLCRALYFFLGTQTCYSCIFGVHYGSVYAAFVLHAQAAEAPPPVSLMV